MLTFKSELLRRLFNYGFIFSFRLYRDEYLFRTLNKKLKTNNDLIELYKSETFQKNILIRYENHFARMNSDNPFLKRGYQYNRCRKISYFTS